jgi:hypothetical protein
MNLLITVELELLKRCTYHSAAPVQGAQFIFHQVHDFLGTVSVI